MSRLKVVVYGITGMVGTRIGQLLSNDFKIIAPPRSHLDLMDKRKVLEHIKDVLPDRIIYSAGLTKVDEAQSNPKLAYLVNAQIPKFISIHAAKFKIPVAYISTDAVFAGTLKKRPYTEKDKPNPMSVYGISKLDGERAVISASRKNCVIRTIMIYSANYPHKKDFARLAYETLSRGEKFQGIVDQVINPTFVDDLVWAIGAVIKKKAKGIYHVAAKDYTTNYGFVEKITKSFSFKKSLIEKVTFDQFFKDKKAPRTQYSWIDTSKFQKEFGHGILHTIDEGISLFKKQLKNVESLPVDI